MTEEGKAIIEFLNCDYELIQYSGNCKELMDRFNALEVQGKTDGFFPLIIGPSDILEESIEFVFEDDVENTPEGIAVYRKTTIGAAGEIEPEEYLASRLEEALEPYEDEAFDIFGEFTQTGPQNSLADHIFRSAEIIIAKIPAENPWELAIWMPMGGFNDCPLPEEQAAVFRYWNDKYGAVPVAVSYDTWQMKLTNPPMSEEEAELLAKEYYAFCPDAVEQGMETIRELASTLINSSMWFFWWD